MKIYLTISIVISLALIVSLLVIPVVIKWVRHKGLLAQPNHRTSHVIPTPSMGGIGIFFGLLAVLPFLNYNIEIITILVSACVLFGVGLWDDFYDMKSLLKLFIQIGCATALYFAGFSIDNLHGILGIYEIPKIVACIITILFITGVTNAFNLIDGIDGLAGSITLINSSFFGVIFLVNNQFTFALIAFALSGAIVGFLKYNFFPAKIFMGDTGSLFLGLLMSVFVIKTFQTNTSAELSTSLSVVLIFLPVFDTLRLFAKRILKNKSPFLADKNHLHHLVLKIVPNHAYATGIICFLHGVLLSLILLQNYLKGELLLTILIVSLALLVTLFLVLVVFLELKQNIYNLKKMVKSITRKNQLLEKI